MIVVAAGTRPSHCNGAARGGSCSALVYWSTTAAGRLVLVDCDIEGGRRPSEPKDAGQLDMLSGGEAPVHDGVGVSHFLTCVDADLFGRGAR